MTDKKYSGSDFQESDVLKGLAVGLISGLAATFVMTQFQNVVNKLSEGDEKEKPKKSSSQHNKGQKSQGQNKQQAHQKEGEDATVKTAKAISENVFAHQLTRHRVGDSLR